MVTQGLMDAFLLFLLGTLGWKLFACFRVPASDMLGAFCVTSLVFVSGYDVSFPEIPITLASKLVLGSALGLMVDRSTLGHLKKIALPAAIVSLWMISLSLVSGYVLYKVSHLGMETAFLGSTAGGIAEMAILGFSFHADTVTVTVLQLFRVLLFLIAMPFFARRQTQPREPRPPHEDKGPRETAPGSQKREDKPLRRTFSLASFLDTIVSRPILLVGAALLGGFAGKYAGLPAGDMLGAMVGVGITNTLVGDLPEVPSGIKSYARISIGIAMAQQLNPETLQKLSTLVFPILLLGTLMVGSGFLLSRVLERLTGWDRRTCLLVSSPGGITQMSVIAEEVGADPLIVSVLHTTRLLSILLVLPLVFKSLLLP